MIVDTHSSTVCSKCYNRLMTLKHSVHSSSTTLEKAKADVESAATLWVGYDIDSDWPVSACPVCCQVSHISVMQSSRQLMYPCVQLHTPTDSTSLFPGYYIKQLCFKRLGTEYKDNNTLLTNSNTHTDTDSDSISPVWASVLETVEYFSNLSLPTEKLVDSNDDKLNFAWTAYVMLWKRCTLRSRMLKMSSKLHEHAIVV